MPAKQRSAVMQHTQKPPRFPSTAFAVALRLRGGVPRRAVLGRSPSLLATGRTASSGASASPVCRANDPR